MGYIADSMLPLFEGVPIQAAPASPPGRSDAEARAEAMRAAFEAADEVFKREYRAFVLRYAATHETFIAEQAADAYRDCEHLPQPREWRSTGGVIQSLEKEGLIEWVDNNGWSKKRGVPMRRYRLKK